MTFWSKFTNDSYLFTYFCLATQSKIPLSKENCFLPPQLLPVQRAEVCPETVHSLPMAILGPWAFQGLKEMFQGGSAGSFWKSVGLVLNGLG